MIAASPALGPGPAALNMTLRNSPPAATGRKRSRSMIFQDDGEQEEQCWDRASNSSGQGSTDDLKRTRTTGELDALGVMSTSEAWQLQGIATDLLTAADAASGLEHYVAGRSLIVLCVLEHVDIHYRLLCAALPHLRRLSPTLQPLLLTRDPSFALAHPSPAPFFPAVAAKGHPQNHFLKLGLLHPLGGGQAAMDALVVLDARGRRRLVLPFGWGAGRHFGKAVGGDMVQERLMEVLRVGVEELEREMR